MAGRVLVLREGRVDVEVSHGGEIMITDNILEKTIYLGKGETTRKLWGWLGEMLDPHAAKCTGCGHQVRVHLGDDEAVSVQGCTVEGCHCGRG